MKHLKSTSNKQTIQNFEIRYSAFIIRYSLFKNSQLQFQFQQCFSQIPADGFRRCSQILGAY